MRGGASPDTALTGLELVILAAILICFVLVAVFLQYGGGGLPWNRVFPGGVVAESMYISGDGIQPVGSAIGFSSVSRGQTPLPVIYPRPDASRLGAVQLTVSLFIGDTGAIDTDRLNVTWTTRQVSEQIQKTNLTPLVCPNWSITGKYNMLPGRTADADEWLEPGEQFQILVCPSEGIPRYQSFTLGMYPDGVAVPLRLTRSAPARIQPVMNLG